VKIFFDTEFIEDGKTIDLLSIGMVREDGEKLYLENSNAGWSRANTWVRENVLPKLEAWEYKEPRGSFFEGPDWGAAHPLCWMTPNSIKYRLVAFAGDDPEFWAYYADYDWVVLCQLFGKMVDLPHSWPKFCMDLKQLMVMQGDPKVRKLGDSVAHNALMDAIWVKEIHDSLT
jgi:hypothetical protein